MAQLDQSPATAPVTGIAEPRQNTVSVILRGVRLGLFTAAEADLMIDRVRALTIKSPPSAGDGYPFAGNGHAVGNLLSDPNRTVL
ncbi:hypothetical protein SK571_25640 [Lentzea sp. BCCO 10_0798]|uniref:Uncharacterized protein n=1 Tax=Lentzea kristufekii TaxID=3095430 RepID=A0ABU4TWS5_9PSEU|nr:hypothetical protein [Lentzea sp. BCCO 10_0798]MDX8052778.1 hypothetical protein [Lentzea sp. BCCO 10_0798]